MKKGILFLLLISSVIANAQKTLKDALYGGKLKTDSGTVIRKTDDLSTKIDTSTKKQVEVVKNKQIVVADSAGVQILVQTDPVVDKVDNAAALKDNNKIWKGFMDSMIVSFKEEVLTSKKIKKGTTYYVLVEYEIGTEGQVTINNVYPAPENSYLEQEIKKRLTLTAPQLNPVLASNGKPRKVIKKYNFTLSSE